MSIRLDRTSIPGCVRPLLRFFKARWFELKLSITRVRALPLREDVDISCFVVSPGGVATTALMVHLKKYLRLNDLNDGDGLKHLPRPPDWLRPTDRVLFVTGDPSAAARSIERRGWVSIQGAKLGSPLAVVLPTALGRRALGRAMRRQIGAWTMASMSISVEIMIMHYDDLWSSAQRIAHFFDIDDPSFVSTFPTRRPRHSHEATAPKAGAPQNAG